MRLITFSAVVLLSAAVGACSTQDSRGIADKRSNFSQFIPMNADPARDRLKAVKPYFRQANRVSIMQAIQHACDGRRSGSSLYDPKTGAGYYINCNPKNQQLLNGYVPVNPAVQPHSR